jgi:hypothetical protein
LLLDSCRVFGFGGTPMILVVPPGAESAPISHGTAQYQPYRADHTDSSGRWLVEVPPEVARYLIHNAGFCPCPHPREKPGFLTWQREIP